MADKTHIQWTDATWNPITGCSVVSPGCTNCYAMQLAGTRLKHHPSRAGLTREVNGNHVWTGEVRFNADWLTQPLKWTRPRRVFVCAHADLFHEGVEDHWLDQIFAVMALTPHHTYQILTKRPERMRAYLTRKAGNGRQDIVNHLAWVVTPQVMDLWHPAWRKEEPDGRHRSRGIQAFTTWPLPNVWLGVSVEDQTRADERIPLLLNTPAALRWISAEPLLGPVDLTDIDDGLRDGTRLTFNALSGMAHDGEESITGVFGQPDPKVDWVVVGGESGPKARPMHPDWARSLRDQCATAGVPFFLKQWGEWAPNDTGHAITGGPTPHSHSSYRSATFPDGQRMNYVGKAAAGDLLDGVRHHNWPEPSR